MSRAIKEERGPAQILAFTTRAMAAPEPAQVLALDLQGKRLGYILRWVGPEARLCHRCPQCTLKVGHDGQGMCYTETDTASARRASPLTSA